MRRLQIHDLLKTGADDPTTGRELCDMTGMQRRDISAAVEAERRDGFPICASTDTSRPGYYMAADAGELARYIRSLKHRIAELTETCEALEGAII